MTTIDPRDARNAQPGTFGELLDVDHDAVLSGIITARRVVTRDGEPVSPVLADDDAAYRWLQRHQGMSADWAMTYEGYAIIGAP